LPASPEIRVVEGPPTRDLLVSLAGGPIDALLLVDHGLFADGPPPAAIDQGDAVRGEALRAVFAVELARRAARTVVLSGGDAQAWVDSLATLLAVPLPADLLAPCPLPDRVPTPLFQTYLQPLFAAAGNPAPLVLTWPREAFLDGDAPGNCLPATVEVAGRARIVAYGPYLPLPTGRWRATAFLGFSPDIGKMSFILEIDTGAAVTRGFFEVERGGIFTLDLDVRVVDSFHPIELRLISQESSLEGQVSLIEVALRQSAEGG
jgi:hypothetical protein